MTNISINKLHEFRDHPYQVLDNDEMNSLNGRNHVDFIMVVYIK